MKKMWVKMKILLFSILLSNVFIAPISEATATSENSIADIPPQTEESGDVSSLQSSTGEMTATTSSSLATTSEENSTASTTSSTTEKKTSSAESETSDSTITKPKKSARLAANEA
ncbi:MAG: hypothetical protein RR727_08750, partial [Enterococcus sp.]